MVGIPEEGWPDSIKAIRDVLPLDPSGLTILGTEAAGDLDLPLGPWAEAATKTKARAAKAENQPAAA